MGILTTAEQLKVNTNAAGMGNPLAAAEGYQPVAENRRFALSVDTKNGYISLLDKEGTVWTSLPNGYQDDPLAQNITKIAMESIIQISYSDKLRNIKPSNAKTASVKNGGLTCTTIQNGIRLTYEFKKEGFSIPVEIVIGDDYMDASVMTGEIKETNSDYTLINVSVLPYFGAADSKAQGYVFVPDGSGALIELNQPDQYVEDYSQYVYGREPSTTKLVKEDVSRTVRLPVFGLKNGGNAMMGIITDGAGRSIIHASVNGKRCSYSNVYTEFIYRDSDMVMIEKKGQTIRVIEKSPPKPERYRVRYYFLNGENADYVGMAHRFGQWLMAGKSKAESVSSTPLYLELTGGVMVQDNIMGFPVDRVAPLTTYDDVEEITGKLTEQGVDALTVYYKYWQKGGTGAAIPVSVAPEGRLGGKSGFKSMLDTLKKQGTPVYLDFNLTDLNKSRWGYSTRSDSVSSIQLSPAVQYRYFLNTMRAVFSEPSFLLNLKKTGKAASSIANSAKKYGFTGVAASSLGNTLYSDFSGKTFQRDTADIESARILENMRTMKGRQLLSEPNAYALPYADIAVDTPIFSSGFLTETCEVPFYQLALHEYLAMSTPDINSMSDPATGVLKALEAGIGIKYRFTMNTNERVAQTAMNVLNGPVFSQGASDAVNTWKSVKDLLIQITGKKIVSHTIVTESVRETVFEGGISVVVNYSETDFIYKGTTIKAKDYQAFHV